MSTHDSVISVAILRRIHARQARGLQTTVRDVISESHSLLVTSGKPASVDSVLRVFYGDYVRPWLDQDMLMCGCVRVRPEHMPSLAEMVKLPRNSLVIAFLRVMKRLFRNHKQYQH